MRVTLKYFSGLETMQLPCLAHSCASSAADGVMHKLRASSRPVSRRGVGHHCGQPVPRPSGHNPWTTKPNRPARPEHCRASAARFSRPRQYSGAQLSASV
jgi:hypothetical protein